MYKCKHYKIQELVSKIVYNKFGDFAWKFFDEDILRDLDTIREYHGQGITVNNWLFGGSNTQCGLRANLDPIVKSKTGLYVSGHILAIAFDGHSNNNKKLYQDIEFLIKNKKLKRIRRLESPISTKYGWVHFDGFQTTNDQLEVFTA